MFRSILFVMGLGFSAVAMATPEVGKPAPDFNAQGADGKSYKLSEFKGKTVVLEWFNNDCPYVHKFYDSKTMQGLQKANTGKGVVWLTIVSSAKGKEGFVTPDAAKKVRSEVGMESTAFLLDPQGEVAKAYSAKTTPHMFVIDKKGLLAYQGAIDDHPSANPDTLKGAKNYVTAALMALDKGQPVEVSSSSPYGCSVKY
jgi:peroxiredoxin